MLAAISIENSYNPLSTRKEKNGQLTDSKADPHKYEYILNIPIKLKSDLFHLRECYLKPFAFALINKTVNLMKFL